MNTPSPLVPQGTSPEPRRRSHLTAVFIILFIHVGVLAGLLLQGCKNETDTTKTSPDGGGFPPTFGTDATPTNPPFPASAVHDLTNNLASTPPPPGVPSGAAPAPYSTPATGTAPPPSYPLPSTPVPAVPSPSAEPVLTSTPSQDHTVMKGETLAIIAKKYNMGWKSIAAANPGLDPTRLKIGQKITIPAKTVSAAPSRIDAGVSGMAENGAEGGTYVVKSGDTLSKIAKNNGTTIKALKALNGLKLDRITVGTKLKIPAKATLQPADPGASAFPASATPVAPVPQNPGTAYASPTLPPPGGRSP